MANEIRSAFNAAFADGPSSAPMQPTKASIRSIGTVIDAKIDDVSRAVENTAAELVEQINSVNAELVEQINSVNAPRIPFSTKAAMVASLNYAADREARVYNDGGNNGIYRKVGASGSGSWAYVGPILEGDTTAIEAEIEGFTSDGNRGIIKIFPGITTEGIEAPEVSDPAFIEAQTDRFGNVISGTRQKGGHFDAYHATPYPDVLHVVCMSQSLGIGYESLPTISSGVNRWGGLSFVGDAYGQLTWLDDGNAQTPGARYDELLGIGAMTDRLSQFAIGETIANGLADGIKARVAGMFSRFPQEETKPQVLFSNACTGDRFLTEIGPEDSATNAANAGFRGRGGNYKTTVDDMRRAYGWCSDLALRYGVVTVFMQGEQEAGYRKLYAWEGSTYTFDALIAGYRDKLKVLADSIDADDAYITGRRRRAPFITYQTADTIIGEAQLQAVEQGRDMFMASPIYYLPNAKNSVIGTGSSQTYGAAVHIAADAERLLGEQFAKVIHRIVAEGENWQPLKRRSVRKIDNTTIELTIDIPRGALVVDTDFLAKAEGWGFEVWSGLTPDDRIAGTATRVVPNSIEIRGNFIRLGLPSSIGIGNWYLRYAGNATCDLGATLTVATVRDGPNTANGFATKELVLTADRSGALAPLVREGAFNLWQGSSRMTVRTVYQEGAVTVLRGEAREIDNGPMIAGVVAPTRWVGYGNIRDSDRALAVNNWSSQAYHQRTGRYPLWNWLVAFDNLRIV